MGYPEVLALRLLSGEVIELVDEHGRVWRATATRLDLVLPGSSEAGPLLQGVDAYEVAWMLAGLRR